MSSRRVILPKGVIKFRPPSHTGTVEEEPGASNHDAPLDRSHEAARVQTPSPDPQPSLPDPGNSTDRTVSDSGPEGPKPGAAPPRPVSHTARLPALDLKEVQRKAYERGRKVALEESGGVLLGMATKLKELMANLARARERDQVEINEFTVRLACAMAEDLISTHVDQDAHDIRGMVQNALDEVMPTMELQTVGLELHPEDLARLPEQFEHNGQHLVCRSDPKLPKGEFRMSGGGAEFYAGLTDRLATMREQLVERSQDASA